MTQQMFSVPGITCDHCATAIRQSVREVPGVHAVDVDVPARTVSVTGDGDTAAVRAAIADAGYQAA